MLNKKEENIRKLVAKDAMIKPVFVYLNDDSQTIIKKLKKENVNVCLAVKKDKTFVGEISDDDLIKIFLHQAIFEPLAKELNVGYRRTIMYKKAKNLIRKHNSLVSLDTPINKVIELIYKKGFTYIPVVDKKKKVLGVVTPSSLLDLLEEY